MAGPQPPAALTAPSAAPRRLDSAFDRVVGQESAPPASPPDRQPEVRAQPTTRRAYDPTRGHVSWLATIDAPPIAPRSMSMSSRAQVPEVVPGRVAMYDGLRDRVLTDRVMSVSRGMRQRAAAHSSGGHGREMPQNKGRGVVTAEMLVRRWPSARLSFDGTPPVPLSCVSMGINRGCHQNDSLADGCAPL